MTESFSATQSALLRVFRMKGAEAGDALPTAVLAESVVLSGGAPVLNGAIETALLDLQFRGLLEPGPDPFSATSWMLTEAGDDVVNSRNAS
jgi:hypothetical protein